MQRIIESVVRPGKALSVIWRSLGVGSVPLRVRYDAFRYPHYAYGVFQAALLAKSLGVPRISVAEFGVAGGRGLLAMERAAIEIERWAGVGIDVYGFDTGNGMPAPVDARDHRYIWSSGMLVMDQDKLKSKLQRAKLVIGEAAQTIPGFLSTVQWPLGFVSVDVDYYSSTVGVFKLFEGATSTRLPRVYLYMDDVDIPDPEELHYHAFTDFAGERLAIRDFNGAHEQMKISKLHGLANQRPIRSQWSDKIYVMHDFRHPQYDTLITPKRYTELAI